MEKVNYGAFEFSSTLGLDCDWAEGFPENIFTDIGCDKQGYS